ncbi:MAG: hypothetical protein HOV94_36340 [Saccharothrix sp.]|nr:hypothetical protein [Saccharothrix sp.]
MEVLERSPTTAVARVAVAADDPVFAGHFPGRPILPGAALVELAHRAVTALSGEVAAPRLVGVETARFLRPVGPGSVLTVRLSWDSAERCAAVVSDEDGVVARVRLRYGR